MHLYRKVFSKVKNQYNYRVNFELNVTNSDQNEIVQTIIEKRSFDFILQVHSNTRHISKVS